MNRLLIALLILGFVGQSLVVAMSTQCSATVPCHYGGGCDGGSCDCPDFTTGHFCETVLAAALGPVPTAPPGQPPLTGCSDQYPCVNGNQCDPGPPGQLGVCDCPEGKGGTFCEIVTVAF